jgi:hypothetical protein
MSRAIDTKLGIMLAAVVVFTGGLILTASAGNEGQQCHGEGKECTRCEDGGKQCKKCESGGKHECKHAARADHRAKSAKHLQDALAKLSAAEDAVKSGNTTAAHNAIKDARKLVLAVHETVRPAVANKKCPIMGGKVKTDAVPANLYRMHQGKGVAFCCAGCPAAWDKLSADNKSKKLQAVGVKMTKPEKGDVKFVEEAPADELSEAVNGAKTKSCGGREAKSCGSK